MFASILNPWLVFSLALLGVWAALFILMPAARRRMFWASLLTAPFGLTEPLFVPAYWSPPSLFDLAQNTGFDVESLIFSFAIGGIGVVLYEALFKSGHARMSKHEMHGRRHRFHKLALASPAIVLIPLLFLTKINPIYSVSLAMFAGGIASVLCRPDLKRKVLAGGLLFLALYFGFFLAFDRAYPGFVQQVWNLPALTGVLVLGVPLEELMFAFTFGMMWSGIYEHLTWSRLTKNKKRARTHGSGTRARTS